MNALDIQSVHQVHNFRAQVILTNEHNSMSEGQFIHGCNLYSEITFYSRRDQSLENY